MRAEQIKHLQSAFARIGARVNKKVQVEQQHPREGSSSSSEDGRSEPADLSGVISTAMLLPSPELSARYVGRPVCLGVSAQRAVDESDPVRQPYWHTPSIKAVLDAVVGFQLASCGKAPYPTDQLFARVMVAHSTGRFVDADNLRDFFDAYSGKEELFSGSEPSGESFSEEEILAVFEFLKELWRFTNSPKVLAVADAAEEEWKGKFEERFSLAVPEGLHSRFKVDTMRSFDSPDMATGTWLDQLCSECIRVQNGVPPSLFNNVLRGAINYAGRHVKAASHPTLLAVASMLVVLYERVFIDQVVSSGNLVVYDTDTGTPGRSLNKNALRALQRPEFLICAVHAGPFKKIAGDAFVTGSAEGKHLNAALSVALMAPSSPPSSPIANILDLGKVKKLEVLVARAWAELRKDNAVQFDSTVFYPSDLATRNPKKYDAIGSSIEVTEQGCPTMSVSLDDAGRGVLEVRAKEYLDKNPSPPRVASPALPPAAVPASVRRRPSGDASSFALSAAAPRSSSDLDQVRGIIARKLKSAAPSSTASVANSSVVLFAAAVAAPPPLSLDAQDQGEISREPESAESVAAAAALMRYHPNSPGATAEAH